MQSELPAQPGWNPYWLRDSWGHKTKSLVPACIYGVATDAQINANRVNSLKSTGPKSAIGKMIASRNSTRHGFYSTSVLLPEEDKEEFLRFARRLVSAHSPCGVLEEELVRSIIETRWQLRRANVVDSELFQIYAVYEGQRRGVGTAFAQDATQGNAFTKLTRYQSFLLRKLHLAERDLLALKAQSTQAVPIVDTAVNSESDLAVRKTVVVSAPDTLEPKLIEDHAPAPKTNAGG